MLDIPKRSYLGTPATAPGPSGPRMLPAFAGIRRNPLNYLHHIWRTYGDIAQFPIPRPPSYLLTDPQAVRRVLVDRARDYTKDTLQYRALALVTGQGLLVSQDPREHRRILQPAFHPDRLAPLVRQVDQSGEHLVAHWQRLPSHSVVDVEHAMATIALETVGQALFGQNLTADAERLVAATLDGLEVVIARARVPITPPSWMPTPRNRKLARANAELDSAAGQLVRSRRLRVGSPESSDALDLLMHARSDSGEGLTTAEIRDEIVTMIVAGHETVASALTWCLALLASNADMQQRVREEVDGVLSDQQLSMAQLGQLPLVRAVIDETMRLYPPAWLITRKATIDDELAQARIPAGALMIMSPYLVHRHPEYWSQPETFDPDRFLLGQVDRIAFIPFGAGPRLCIGRDFAYAEAVALLATLIRQFEFTFPTGMQFPAFDPGVTMRPVGGLKLRIVQRS
ncbi:MAG: cytochrome P450 [Actinomycetota bacterium]|nr:cytochrome P450 [Actinomycetota bacterium]